MSRAQDSVPASPDAGEPEAESEPPPRLAIDIVHDDGDWTGFGAVDELVLAAARALAADAAVAAHLPATACLALSSDATVRRLNRTYRDKDKPTNVLSFPAETPRAAPGAGNDDGADDAPPFLGDVVLAAGTVLAEAAEQGLPAAHHLQHLVVHGLLHLMGLDHQTEADAALMEGLETAALARLGIPDPYATD